MKAARAVGAAGHAVAAADAAVHVHHDDAVFGVLVGGLRRADAHAGTKAGRSLLKEHLKEIFKDLSEREQEILKMRFGLKDGATSSTLEEVGQKV